MEQLLRDFPQRAQLPPAAAAAGAGGLLAAAPAATPVIAAAVTPELERELWKLFGGARGGLAGDVKRAAVRLLVSAGPAPAPLPLPPGSGVPPFSLPPAALAARVSQQVSMERNEALVIPWAKLEPHLLQVGGWVGCWPEGGGGGG